jgi:hypothetical protein
MSPKPARKKKKTPKPIKHVLEEETRIRLGCAGEGGVELEEKAG